MHLNRGVNQDGLKVNPQTDLNALWTAIGGKENFTDALAAELPAGAKLLDFDIQLFDAQPAQLGGFDDEWVYSGRLDNLSSCHAIAEAFAAALALEKDFQVAAFFNNEEVGSETREGAAGNFLKSVLEEVLSSVLPRLVKSPYKIDILPFTLSIIPAVFPKEELIIFKSPATLVKLFPESKLSDTFKKAMQ